MDPFEKQLRDLPWREPSNELRERLFASSEQEEDKVIRSASFGTGMPWAWAAAILVSTGLITYALWPNTELPLAVIDGPHAMPVLLADSQPIEFAISQTFFDFSSATDDTWAGSLTLKIEAN